MGESFNGAGLGRGSDLEMATQLVGRMLFEWGLGDQLMHAAPPALPAGATDKIEPLLQATQIRAAEIIEMQRPLVIKLAEALLTVRQLLSERLQGLLQDNQRTPRQLRCQLQRGHWTSRGVLCRKLLRGL